MCNAPTGKAHQPSEKQRAMHKARFDGVRAEYKKNPWDNDMKVSPDKMEQTHNDLPMSDMLARMSGLTHEEFMASAPRKYIVGPNKTISRRHGSFTQVSTRTINPEYTKWLRKQQMMLRLRMSTGMRLSTGPI